MLILFFIAGIILWTFLEYVLHRFLGHKPKAKNEFTAEHLRHHRETHYFAPLWKKALAAMAVLGTLTVLLGFAVGWMAGFSFSFGLSSMYLFYEVLHKRAHTHAPVNFYGKWLRKHHFHHHFKNPKKNHGVTSPFWDWVFGTLDSPEIVFVPRKVMLDWLVDSATNAILPQFENDYRYREGATAKVE